MDFEKLYIDGQWTSGASNRFIEVENPAPEKFLPVCPPEMKWT